MSKNIEMNYKTDSGYEVLYPKTNSDQIQMSDGSGNLNDGFQEVYNYRACSLGNIVGDSINSDFINKIGDSFISCDGSILSTADYPEMEDYIVGVPYNDVETLNYTMDGVGLLAAYSLVEGENNRIIALGSKTSSTNCSIYISDDNGKNFIEKVKLGTNPTINVWLNTGVKLNNGAICFFISNKRYITYDNGNSFQSQQINSGVGQHQGLSQVLVLPNGRLCAFNQMDSGIYYSDDDGLNWLIKPNTFAFTERTLFCYNDVLYLTSTSGSRLKINKSLDYGNNWNDGEVFNLDSTNDIYFPYVYRKKLCFNVDNKLFQLNGDSWIQKDIITPISDGGSTKDHHLYNVDSIIVGVSAYSTDGGINWINRSVSGNCFVLLKNNKTYSISNGGFNYYSSIDKNSFQIPNIPNHYIRVK